MQITKKQKRLKRAKKTRLRIKSKNKVRLVVNKSNKHIYAQVIDSNLDNSDQVIASASTLDKEVKNSSKNVLSNIECAKKVGILIAERALKSDTKIVAFDRSGFKYHGCIKSLADSARETGLIF